MGGKHKVAVLRGGNVDDERFHVTVGFRFRQRVILHVFPALDGVIREADAVLGLCFATNYRAGFILVIKECTETNSQYTGYFN